MVIAVPAALIVQGNQEEVGLFELNQAGLALAAIGDRVAQRAGQAIEDGRLEEKRCYVRRLAVQHFLDEVVEDKAIAARKAGDEAGDVAPSLEGEGSQLQSRGPALGALLKNGDGLAVQRQPQGLVEEGCHFLFPEAQVARPQLGDAAPGALAGEGKGRVVAREEDQMHLGWHVLDEQSDGGLDSRCVDGVVVVENHGEGLGRLGDLVDNSLHECLRRRSLCGFGGNGRGAKAGAHPLQGSAQVVEEGCKVIVALVQVNPGARAWRAALCFRSLQPFGDERGLAVARRCGDKGKAMALAESVVQVLDQPRPMDKIGPEWWYEQLSCQETGRH